MTPRRQNRSSHRRVRSPLLSIPSQAATRLACPGRNLLDTPSKPSKLGAASTVVRAKSAKRLMSLPWRSPLPSRNYRLACRRFLRPITNLPMPAVHRPVIHQSHSASCGICCAPIRPLRCSQQCSSALRLLLLWHFRALLSGLGKADGDRLLLALRLVPRFPAVLLALLILVHRLFDFRLRLFPVLRHWLLLSRWAMK